MCVFSTETWVQPTESNAPSLRCLWWVLPELPKCIQCVILLFCCAVPNPALPCVSGWKQVFRNDVEENEGRQLRRCRSFHRRGIPGRCEPFPMVCFVFYSRAFIGPTSFFSSIFPYVLRSTCARVLPKLIKNFDLKTGFSLRFSCIFSLRLQHTVLIDKSKLYSHCVGIRDAEDDARQHVFVSRLSAAAQEVSVYWKYDKCCKRGVLSKKEVRLRSV